MHNGLGRNCPYTWLIPVATVYEMSKDQETIGKLRVFMFYLTRERPTRSEKHESIPAGWAASLPDVCCPIDTKNMISGLTLETHSVSLKGINVQSIGATTAFPKVELKTTRLLVLSWADGTEMQIATRDEIASTRGHG